MPDWSGGVFYNRVKGIYVRPTILRCSLVATTVIPGRVQDYLWQIRLQRNCTPGEGISRTLPYWRGEAETNVGRYRMESSGSLQGNDIT